MIFGADIGLQKMAGSLTPQLRWDAAKEARVNFMVASALVVLILAYTAFAMVQGLISFSMNRVIGALLALILFYDFLKHLSGLKVIAACLFGVCAIFSLGIFSTSLDKDFEFYLYVGCTLLFLSYSSRTTSMRCMLSAIRKHRTLLLLCLGFSSLLTIFALVTRVGFVSSWGGDSYFVGFTNAEHTMASISCLVMAIAYVAFKEGGLGKVPVFVVFAIFSFATLETGARTFLIPIALLWFAYVNDRRVIEHRWLRIVLIALLVLAAVGVFATSSMATKFDYLSTLSSERSTDGLNGFTSGRLEYWRIDLMGFFGSNVFNQIFGNSASFVYALNYQVFHMPIWSHDDFVMIICSAGYIGFFVYASALAGFFKRLKPRLGRMHYGVLLAYILLPAVINGFYGYQHFVYSAILLACAFACSASDCSGDSIEF